MENLHTCTAGGAGFAELEDGLKAAGRELHEIEEVYQTRLLPQVDDAHRRCMVHLRGIKKAMHERVEADTQQFNAALSEIRQQKDIIERDATESNAMYRGYIPQEFEAFKSAVTHEASLREEADDALVKALNEYNTALHNGFSTVLRGGG